MPLSVAGSVKASKVMLFGAAARFGGAVPLYCSVSFTFLRGLGGT